MKGRSHRLQSTDPPDDWVDGSWTVDCVCGVTFDDGEEMVNCDECGVWVHTRCSRYVKGDESFACDKCKSKSNRNDSEETEVAQLLVELPTKTVRMESSYASNGPSRRPFRLWTDIPMEERVHVHGIPGGDPGLFGGLTSVFTPELWKCTGYVPKKFNFQYKEFPCWDEKEGDARIEQEYENPEDKGAGVLFSLSKENALATSVATLAGMKNRDEEGACDRRADVGHAQNGIKHRGLLPHVVMHSGKRKKEDSGSLKDRSGKKKARSSDKESDRKRKSGHTSNTVFAPPSDAKQVEFNEDRGTKSSKTGSRIIKNRNLMNTIPQTSVSNSCLASDINDERPKNKVALDLPREAPFSDTSKHTFSIEAGQKEEKAALQVESSSKTNVVAPLQTEHDDVRNIPIKEEGDDLPHDKLDNSIEDSCRNVLKSPVKDPVSAVLEVTDKQALQNSISDISLSSVPPNVKVTSEEIGNSSRGTMNNQSCPLREKQPIISTDSSKGNDAGVSSSQSSDHKVQDAEKSSAVSGCQTDKTDEISGIPCQPKRELGGSEGPKAVLPSSSEPKHNLGCAEGVTMVNSPAPPNLRKMVVSVGKSSSASSNIPKSSSTSSVVIPKSSALDNTRDEDIENPNTITKRVVPDCNVAVKRDRSASDVARGQDSRDMEKKMVKDHPKSSVNSASKASHSSRISHSSASKRNLLDSRDSVVSSSKASPAHNTGVASGSSESAGGVQNHGSLHSQNKTAGSGLPQRGEKTNQSNVQLSHKANYVQPMHPPASSSSPATLSDEELALLLHQELNSSPRVPRVPRVRHAGSLPQLASPTATSMLLKRSASSSAKDHSMGSRRKNKDASREGFRSSRELDDDAKKIDRVSSPDRRRQDLAFAADSSLKRGDNGSSDSVHSTKKNIPLAPTLTTNSVPSSSTEVNGHNKSSMRNSPRHISDDDTGTVGGPVHRTLPGLINEIMSKGQRMTYEELCNAVLPHWHNLRKHNGERYAYSSHSQAVLDCLRNRHEWAQLVDRGPKTNSSRKRRKLDAETPSEDDSEYGKGRNTREEESKSLESQHEDFPKGKRKARKRRRLALQGRGIKDIRKRRKADSLTDDDSGPFSNSSEESLFSDDEIHGGGTGPVGSEASASSDGTRAT